jgi:small subunit ribosomal protein S6
MRQSSRFRAAFELLSLAFVLKIRIKRAIRGSRPGAERTVSAISPFSAMLMWQGQLARRPVLPPSEHIESFPKGSKGLPPGPTPTQERTSMSLYEHVFLARQDASTQQVEELTAQMTGIVEQLGGKVTKTENWGVRSLTYRMNKNRKAHFVLLNIDAPSAAIAEIERQERISEDVIRYLSVRVDEHEEGPSAMMRKADRDRERDDRGGGFRGDRDGGFRGDRDGGGYRGDRGPRRGRDEAETAVVEE